MTRFEVIVRPQPGMADPPAAAISTALRDSGYGDCAVHTVGRYLMLQVAEADVERAAQQAHALCRELLVSPHLETYELRRLPPPSEPPLATPALPLPPSEAAR